MPIKVRKPPSQKAKPAPSENEPKPPDWWELERRFVRGTESGPKFAEAEGVSYSSVHWHITYHRWEEKRAQFQARLTDETTKAEIRRRKRLSASIDQTVSDILGTVPDRIAEQLETEQDLAKMNAGVAALTGAYRLQREANGLPKERPPAQEKESGYEHVLVKLELSDGSLWLYDPASGFKFIQDPANKVAPPDWIVQAAADNEDLDDPFAAPRKGPERSGEVPGGSESSGEAAPR